ncbi:MAG: HAD-IIIC family phosphatase, partial [Myxococcales bacterium]|nr:HAD-IIIC family phosphatase [Myxococcales bacterium]
PWKEHRTECAMPSCYSTCDLYAPRRDGKCRRFVTGIETIPLPEHPQGYVAKVAFKRWGQLMAYANTRVIPVAEASAIERRVRRVEILAEGWPGASVSVASRRGIPSRLAGRWKQRVSERAGTPISDEPDCLLIEVFNPGPAMVGLSLTVSNPGRPPFQALLELPPGFRAVEVPVTLMQTEGAVDLEGEILIALDPNITRPEEEGLTLYFGLLAFVIREPGPAPVDRVEPIKVAVWDLDQTIWSGTLAEDGLEGLHLREDVVRVLRELDRRGIVNSVISKNHPQDGLDALRHFGIEELFAFPKIGWGDKGTAMRQTVGDFDLDARTFAFIDDQAFERAQVTAANPGVRAYDSHQALGLLDLPEFRPAQSTESSNRRQFYRAEQQRVQAQACLAGDYVAFLRTCDLHVDIAHPDRSSTDRIHELVQRTNQLNYSGTHYTRDQANAIIEDPANECFVVACRDIYGAYGTVGFMVVDREQARLRDAMFSCRIHFKHVEHAAITFLLQMFRSRRAARFDAQFRETTRNAAAAAVFDDLGFLEVSHRGPDRLYRFDLGKQIPDEGIVTINYEGVPWEPSQPSSDV